MPLWGHSQENVLRYIGICRVAFDPSKKIKFHEGGGQGSYGGNWDRNGGNGNMKNLEGKNHRSSTGYGAGRGGNVGGIQHGNNRRGRG